MSNKVKGFWNEFFCPYYGKMIDPSKFNDRVCDTCLHKKACRQKYLRKLRKYSKIYGGISKIPEEKLMNLMTKRL